jgi:hypothetical protein
MVLVNGAYETPAAPQSFFQKAWSAVKAVASTVVETVKQAYAVVVEYCIGGYLMSDSLTMHSVFAAGLFCLAVVSPQLFAVVVVTAVFTLAFCMPVFVALDMWSYHRTFKRTA